MKNEDKLRHLYRLYDGNLRKLRKQKKDIISIQKRIRELEDGGKGWTMQELLNDLNMQIRRCEENYWIEPLIQLKWRKENLEKLIKEKKENKELKKVLLEIGNEVYAGHYKEELLEIDRITFYEKDEDDEEDEDTIAIDFMYREDEDSAGEDQVHITLKDIYDYIMKQEIILWDDIREEREQEYEDMLKEEEELEKGKK